MDSGNRRVKRHFSYSNVMSTLAVFLLIAGGTAIAGQVKNNSIKSKHIKNGQVKRADLATDSVKSTKVADDSLTGADIDESQLTLPPPTGPAGGALTGTYPNPALANGSVGTANLQDDAVDSAKLASGSVGQPEIQTDGVGETEIGPNSVSADELLGITTVEAEVTGVANGATNGVTADCPVNSQIISGGYETGVSGNQEWNIRRDRQFGNGWRVFGANQSGGVGSLKVFANCLIA